MYAIRAASVGDHLSRRIHFWLRAEQKPQEHRTLLLPAHVSTLLKAGHRVTVEESVQRCVPIEDYKQINAEIVAEGSWVGAPIDAIILGLKELPEDSTPLVHTHVYFAHCFKGQSHAREILDRFKAGNGKLYDLEFLVDEQGRRVSAFGNAAGMVGMALGTLVWSWQRQGIAVPACTQTFKTYRDLAEFVKSNMGAEMPSILVVGASGRVGGGSVAMAQMIGIDPTKWDIAETAGKKGPFSEILEYDIFVNTVYLPPSLPKDQRFTFLTHESLRTPNKKLATVVDISCDVNNKANPVPIYSSTTSFTDPALTVDCSPADPVSVVSIDHLPSMVPEESSLEFADGLMPHLLEAFTTPVWDRALRLFEQKRDME